VFFYRNRITIENSVIATLRKNLQCILWPMYRLGQKKNFDPRETCSSNIIFKKKKADGEFVGSERSTIDPTIAKHLFSIEYMLNRYMK